MNRWIAMGVLVALGVLPGITGCRTIERANARNTGDVLTAAGFRQIPASSPEAMGALQTMKPRTIKQVRRAGKTWFVYPDPSYCNCLYVGTAEDYRQYQRLVLQKRIAEEKLEAAEATEISSLSQPTWGTWW